MTRGRGISGIFQHKLKSLPWPPLLVFLLLTIGISTSGYFFYKKQKKDIYREQTVKLWAVADLKANEISRWLNERLGDARLISENPILTTELLAFLHDRPAGPRWESIRNWMESLRNNYHYQNVLLLDRSGEVVLALARPYPVIDSAGLELMEAVRRRKGAIISDLQHSANMAHPHLDVVAPLLAADTLGGFVFLCIDPAEFLYPMIQSWPTPSPSAETLLVRREGNEVVYLNELRHRKNTTLNLRIPLSSTRLPAAQAVLGRQGIFSGIDYRGIPVWSVVRPVENSSWFIVAKIDREEIERPICRNALEIFLIALFLILAIALMILFLWQRQNTSFRLRQFEAQRESEDKFKHVFEAANVAKSITLPTGEINVNQAFCAMLGYSQEELENKKWQELTPPDEIEASQRILEPLLDGRENTIRFNKHYIHKNGSHIYGDVNIAIRRDPAGKPLFFITTRVDITARNRAEEEKFKQKAQLEDRVVKRTAQLQAANKELEAFSYSVLHDLRAPLRAIEGFSRIVLEGYAPKLDEEGRRLLDVIIGNTSKMGQLIDDLLAFSRLSRQQMAFAPVDLAALADTVFSELKNLEKGRRIKLEINALPAAFGDRSMLRQILQNLLANAIKFTRTRSRARIELSGHAGEGENVYQVKDNGVGFDMEYSHKLFGVFQRLHGSDEFEGTGIGLAIVQRIVLRHGGRVWAESAAKGGATFYFSLPTETSSETAASEDKPADVKEEK